MANTAEAPAEVEPVEIVRRVIGTVGVADLVRLIADVTQEEADRLLLSGDRVKAAVRMHQFRIVQRAADLLRH